MKNTTINKMTPWLIVLTSSLLFFYHFFQFNVLNSLGLWIMQDFKMDAEQLGLLSSTFFLANFIFVIPAGILLDRYSAKKICIIAMALIVFSILGTATASGYITLTLYRIIAGIGGAFSFLSCIRFISRWFPSERMAFITGCVITIGMLGGIMAQTPLIWLIETLHSWREPLWIVGILGVGIMGMMMALLRDAPKPSLIHSIVTALSLRQSIATVLLDYKNWLIGLYITLINLPLLLLGGLWGTSYLVYVHHFSKLQSSYPITFLFLGMIMGSPVLGWISDYLDQRIVPMIIGALFALITVLSLLYFMPTTLYGMCLLFFFLGFFVAIQTLGYPLIAELNDPTLTSTATSVTSLLIMASGVIAQPLFGFLMNWHWNHLLIGGVPIYTLSNFHLAMLILPLALILGGLTIVILKATVKSIS